MSFYGGKSMSKGYSIKVNIGGKSYGLISSEKPEYLSDVAERVDKSITKLLSDNPSLTYEKAAILTALKFCDDAKKSEQLNLSTEEIIDYGGEIHNFRRQLVEYSKEIATLTKENRQLLKELSILKKESNE